MTIATLFGQAMRSMPDIRFYDFSLNRGVYLRPVGDMTDDNWLSVFMCGVFNRSCLWVPVYLVPSDDVEMMKKKIQEAADSREPKE
jgi:hypothetical protein